MTYNTTFMPFSLNCKGSLPIVPDFSRLNKAMNYFNRAAVIFFLFTMCLLHISGSPASSQDTGFSIGPRDILTLTIFAGGEKQQEINLTVSAQGMINVPFVGSIKAEGFTISQLEKIITEPLSRDYFVNPEVNIFIKEYHSLQYYISGAVNSPGLYTMTSETTLMKLIAKAGGVLPERGNVAYILRDSSGYVSEGQNVENLLSHQEPEKIDLKGLLDRGDMRHNPVLKSGDVVYVPLEKTLDLAESKIYVEGEVKNPGVYDYQPGLTALNACIIAGGFDRYAAPNRTRIIRKVNKKIETIMIDLNDVKKGNIPDIELKPGDLLHVPETWL